MAKRLRGWPIAYLTNQKEFYGLNFYVDQRVLIPRPETELLVEEVIKLLKATSYFLKAAITDIGTGSGCIAVTLKKQLPKAKVLAIDVSKTALAVAKYNAKKHKTKIKFYQGSLLSPIKNKKIDVIVANLPYGWPEWKNNTSAETKGLKFEPAKSLFTKEKGLYLYRQLFSQTAKLKNKPKLIFVEFDPRQKTALQNIIKKNLPEAKLEIKKDLAGLNRLLIVTIN